MNAPQRYPDFIRTDRQPDWERAVLREMPRDDFRSAKWAETERRIDGYIWIGCVLVLPILLIQLFWRI